MYIRRLVASFLAIAIAVGMSARARAQCPALTMDPPIGTYLPMAHVGKPYTFGVKAFGGMGPQFWQLTGVTPGLGCTPMGPSSSCVGPGITMQFSQGGNNLNMMCNNEIPGGGQITGTPTARGLYFFTVAVSDWPNYATWPCYTCNGLPTVGAYTIPIDTRVPVHGSHDRGATGSCDQPGTTCVKDPCDTKGGGCTAWNVQLEVAGLTLTDLPVGYNPPLGPAVELRMVYAHRDAQQPATFDYWNFGRKWTSTWLAWVTDSVAANGTAVLYARGGGDETYTFASGASSSQPGPFSQAILTRATDASGATTGFTRQMRDGSIERFERGAGARFYLTATLDPRGNGLTFAYDAQSRLTTVTDAIGQVTTLTYGAASDSLKVTQVTDPFGRAATFTYTADGHLASITDVLGITSQYTWVAGDFITTLTTPYGTSTFTFGDSTTNASLGTTRFVTATDTLGRTTRVEYNEAAPNVADSDPTSQVPTAFATWNQGLSTENTYVWNPTQLAAATAGGGLDYTKARIVHWLQSPGNREVSRVPQCIKAPLENRVWFAYPNQDDAFTLATSSMPTLISRVLDDGSVQTQQAQYNPLGNPTQLTDPSGRQYRFTYDASGIDLVSASNATGTVDVLQTRTYNTRHQPLSITDAAGQTTTYAYNARGQVTQITDALGHATTYSYDANGYLNSVQYPGGATETLTWDAVGRIATATDAALNTLSYTYDAADRPVSVTYADGSSATFGYTLLDVTSTTDSLGRTATWTYDSEREPTKITDALGNAVSLTYQRGGLVATLTDPRGGVMTLTRDLQDRLTARAFADGTRQTIAYESSTSRVKSVTDARNQSVVYAYNVDDTINGFFYMNPVAPTSPVSFVYDTKYRRVTSMTDGIGVTRYSYGAVGAPGANQPTQMQSPIAGGTGMDTVTFTYDALGRSTSQDIAGSTATRTLDALGRMTSMTNALDTFTYSYQGATGRVTGVTSANGPRVAIDFYPAAQRGLVKQLTYQTPAGVTLAQFGYAYDANQQITSFTAGYAAQSSGMIGRRSVPRDGNGVMLAASIVFLAWTWVGRDRKRWRAAWMYSILIVQLVTGCSAPAAVADDGFVPADAATADAATDGGVMNDAAPGDGGTPLVTSTTAYSYDSTSRLTGATTTSAAGTTLSQYAYTYDASSNLTSISANGTTTPLAYDALNQVAAPAVYDANGNATTLAGATYTWDAANRVTSATQPSGDESDFYYDGMNRMVRIVEKHAGAVTADHAYLWCGEARCLERDNLQSGSPVTKRYFAQGVQMNGAAYYYVVDHVGSVRQLVDASGAVRAQYEYDPYGNQTRVSGDLESPITYAGYFHHAASGLALTVYRAYQPQLGRWLNRDPIAEGGGSNLHAYVNGNPVNQVDPTGLIAVSAIGGALKTAYDVGKQIYDVGKAVWPVVGPSLTLAFYQAMGWSVPSSIILGGGEAAMVPATGAPILASVAVYAAAVVVAAAIGVGIGLGINYVDDAVTEQLGFSPFYLVPGIGPVKAVGQIAGRIYSSLVDGHGEGFGDGEGERYVQSTLTLTEADRMVRLKLDADCDRKRREAAAAAKEVF